MMMGVVGTQLVTLAVAVDRFVAVLRPAFYLANSHRLSIPALGLFVSSYAFLSSVSPGTLFLSDSSKWKQGRNQDLVSGDGPLGGGSDPLFFASNPKSQGFLLYVLWATSGFRPPPSPWLRP